MGRQQHVRQVVQRRVGRRQFGIRHIQHRVEPPGDQLRQQRRLVDQRAARGVDQRRPVRHRRQLGGADHVAGGRDLRRVDRHHLGALAQFVQGDQLDAESRRLGGVHVRVVQQDAQVERPQQLDHPSADPGRADDADRTAVVARPAQLLVPVVGGAGLPVAVRGAEDPLSGEEDRGQRVLGDGQGVGRSRRRDRDAPLPTGFRDVVLDAARGVHDRAQLRRGCQDFGGERGRAPAGDEQFGLRERGDDGGVGIRAGEAVRDETGIGAYEAGQPGEMSGGEQPFRDARTHREQRGRPIVRGVVHGGSRSPVRRGQAMAVILRAALSEVKSERLIDRKMIGPGGGGPAPARPGPPRPAAR